MEGTKEQSSREPVLDSMSRPDGTDVSWKRSETMLCPTCGPTRAVWVQSHEQCARCGRVLMSCCDGR